MAAAADKARWATVEGSRVALQRASTANIPQMVASSMDLVIRGGLHSSDHLPTPSPLSASPTRACALVQRVELSHFFINLSRHRWSHPFHVHLQQHAVCLLVCRAVDPHELTVMTRRQGREHWLALSLCVYVGGWLVWNARLHAYVSRIHSIVHVDGICVCCNCVSSGLDLPRTTEYSERAVQCNENDYVALLCPGLLSRDVLHVSSSSCTLACFPQLPQRNCGCGFICICCAERWAV